MRALNSKPLHKGIGSHHICCIDTRQSQTARGQLLWWLFSNSSLDWNTSFNYITGVMNVQGSWNMLHIISMYLIHLNFLQCCLCLCYKNSVCNFQNIPKFLIFVRNINYFIKIEYIIASNRNKMSSHFAKWDCFTCILMLPYMLLFAARPWLIPWCIVQQRLHYVSHEGLSVLALVRWLWCSRLISILHAGKQTSVTMNYLHDKCIC